MYVWKPLKACGFADRDRAMLRRVRERAGGHVPAEACDDVCGMAPVQTTICRRVIGETNLAKSVREKIARNVVPVAALGDVTDPVEVDVVSVRRPMVE